MEEVEIKVDPARLRALVIGNTKYRSSNDYEISPEDEKQARWELNETEETRDTALQTFKEMLSRDKMEYRTDDAFLLRFLRCKKFRCEDAYKKICFYYSLRNDYPDLFYTLPSNFQELLNLNMFTYLPYRDEEGSIIFLDRFGKWNTHELSVADLIRFFQPIGYVITMNPSCQINKVVGILDCKGTNARQLSAVLNPSTFMLWIKTMQDLQPWRLKHVFIVNSNYLLSIVLNATRYLLSKKIAKRIIIVGPDFKELHERVNPALLPKEYGGNLEESECSITQHMMDNLPYLQYENSFHIDSLTH